MRRSDKTSACPASGFGRVVRAMLLNGIILAAVSMQASPAQARNIFQILFGGGQAARDVYPDARQMRAQPDSHSATRQRQIMRAKAAQKRKARQRAALRADRSDSARPVARARHVSLGYTPPKAGKGPLGPFLHDRSLRRGDVVVTSKGLMVFAGRGGEKHRENDFRPYRQGASIAGGRPAQLRAIAKANKNSTAALVSLEVVKTYKKAPHGDGLKLAIRK